MKKNIILIFIFGFLSDNIICEDYDKNNNIINNEIKKELKEIIKEKNKLILENFEEKNKLILEKSDELNNKIKNMGDLLIKYNKINSKIFCMESYFIIYDHDYLYNNCDINRKIEIKSTLNEKFKEFLNLKVKLFNTADILETLSIDFKKLIDKEYLKKLEETFLNIIKKYENI